MSDDEVRGCGGVTSLSFTGPLGWCQRDSFTRRLYATGSNPITEDATCFQSKPEVTSPLFSIFSKLNLESVDDIQLKPEEKLQICFCGHKPIKAARQCGETEFPLSETIC